MTVPLSNDRSLDSESAGHGVSRSACREFATNDRSLREPCARSASAGGGDRAATTQRETTTQPGGYRSIGRLPLSGRLLLGGLAIQERVYLGLVDSGETPGRQRGQHMRVRPRRRPHLAGPPFGQLGGRVLAAVPGRAAGGGPVRGVPAAEPARLGVGGAERDREVALL